MSTLYREWDFPCDCICVYARACFQVLWLWDNHMKLWLTYWDGVPVPKKTPGQEVYCSRISGFNLLSTPKELKGFHQLMLYHDNNTCDNEPVVFY